MVVYLYSPIFCIGIPVCGFTFGPDPVIFPGASVGTGYGAGVGVTPGGSVGALPGAGVGAGQSGILQQGSDGFITSTQPGSKSLNEGHL